MPSISATFAVVHNSSVLQLLATIAGGGLVGAYPRANQAETPAHLGNHPDHDCR
jgi:hypothetical protein